MLALWLVLAGLPASSQFEIEERVVLERGGVRVVESRRIAPTGLPIAGVSRRLMLGDTLLRTSPGAEVLATAWPQPERSETDVRALAEAAGYVVRSLGRRSHRLAPRRAGTGALRRRSRLRP